VSSQTTARRLRLAGTIVLAGGLAGAGFLYWTASRASSIDDLMPGYADKSARQTGIIMGSFVVTLLGWADALKDPATQAVVVAVASILVALVCFRLAWLVHVPDE
jgi:hypothetical protein